MNKYTDNVPLMIIGIWTIISFIFIYFSSDSTIMPFNAVLCLSPSFYLIPSFFAYDRHVQAKRGIFILNTFFLFAFLLAAPHKLIDPHMEMSIFNILFFIISIIMWIVCFIWEESSKKNGDINL